MYLRVKLLASLPIPLSADPLQSLLPLLVETCVGWAYDALAMT